jgi:hypothetical protein
MDEYKISVAPRVVSKNSKSVNLWICLNGPIGNVSGLNFIEKRVSQVIAVVLFS